MVTKESAILIFFFFILVVILFSPCNIKYGTHTGFAAKTVAVLCHFMLCV